MTSATWGPLVLVVPFLRRLMRLVTAQMEKSGTMTVVRPSGCKGELVPLPDTILCRRVIHR